MEMEGFTFKAGKHIGFKAEGQERYTRCDRKLGDFYSEEMIRDRIANKEKYKDVDLSAKQKKTKRAVDIPELAEHKKVDQKTPKAVGAKVISEADKKSDSDSSNEQGEEKRGEAANSFSQNKKMEREDSLTERSD